MSSSKRHITLPMEYGGHGTMLQEITRAFLNTANPSVAIKHILKGIRQYKTESDPENSVWDRMLLNEVEEELIKVFGKISEREKELYDGAIPPVAPKKATVRDTPIAKVSK